MTAAPNMSPRIIYVMSSNCYRYVRSAKCMSTDRVLKHDYRPIPISGRAIGASLVELGGMTKNLYHGIFLNYTGFTVYDGIFFSHG